MFGSLLIPFAALLAVAVLGFYLYIKRRKRREKISEILSGTNLLAHWIYTPVEWQRAVEEEFTWAKSKGGRGPRLHLANRHLREKRFRGSSYRTRRGR